MTSRIADMLENHTIAAAPELVRDEGDGVVRCLACANRCRIAKGKSGICCVRRNVDGVLRVPGGYVAGLQVDPIEKKPLYHVFPGESALSFGMFGCNFHCPFCQNWVSSQILRDDRSTGSAHPVSAGRLVEIALEEGAPVIVSTYNEPLITSDWAAQVFAKAKERGLVCGYVSNGFASREVVEFLRPVMDLFKIDLKCFTEENYRRVGGRLSVVMETIERAKSLGFWVEVVTLVIPGFNDSPAELSAMARFIAGVSREIPWHVTAFHPDYRMADPRPTAPEDLLRAYNTGKEAGLWYVYSGNRPGSVGSTEDTRCHNCDALLIERHGFHVRANRVTGGKCPDCRVPVPGVWRRPDPDQT